MTHSKYIVRKETGEGFETRDVARVLINNQGGVEFEMLAEDEQVNEVLSRAKRDGGLHDRVSFVERESDGRILRGQRHEFVPAGSADFKYALGSNLRHCLVEAIDDEE